MTIEIVELALESVHYRAVKPNLALRGFDLVFEIEAHAVLIGRSDHIRQFH
jgi:hypothetical protein